jgi:uncharacterized protein (TIGR02598 family)
MTTASLGRRSAKSQGKRRFWRAGFSLIEVVVATGLCTYALVVIACLLPMGLGTVQVANSQIVQSEIFNKIWLEVNTTPFADLANYFRVKNGTFPDLTTNGQGLTYFDKDGGELSPTTYSATPPANDVYIVYCSLVYPGSPNAPSSAPSSSRLTALNVDGWTLPSTSGTTTAGMSLFLIEIGSHINPSTVTLPDTRVATRTYVIAKRDTYNGS